MTNDHYVTVAGYVPVSPGEPGELDNVRDQIWSFAMDQRAFGPRKLVVAFAGADGAFRGIAYTNRTDAPLQALESCLVYLGEGAAAAVALCDEPVADEPLPLAWLDRFAAARRLSARYGVHLVDWIGCDDECFRATRLGGSMPGDQSDWWDVPAG